MERLLQEREELGRELEKLQKHRNTIANSRGDTTDIDEEIDNVKSKISYLQVIFFLILVKLFLLYFILFIIG